MKDLARRLSKLEEAEGERPRLTSHYSGDRSRLFWDMVNSLDGEDKAEMYSLGVALQNLEGQVLRRLQQIAPGFVKEGRYHPHPHEEPRR